MNQQDALTFTQAVAYAQAGQKEAAYQQLKDLLKINSNHTDPNLLLWLAFTSPKLEESEAAINMAANLEPANPGIVSARDWLVKEQRKLQQQQNIAPVFATPVIQQTPMMSYQPAPAAPALRPFHQQSSTTYSETGLRSQNLTYAVPGIGALLLFLSPFLTWVHAQIFALDISINGMGQVSGSAKSFLGGTATNNTFTDGYFVLLLGLVTFGLVAVGFLKGLAFIPKVLGLVGIAGILLLLYEVVHATSVFNDPDTPASLDISIGPGQYVGLFGAMLVVGGCAYMIWGRLLPPSIYIKR